eukprot:3755294-Prorocentrum_lima.AAC.1
MKCPYEDARANSLHQPRSLVWRTSAGRPRPSRQATKTLSGDLCLRDEAPSCEPQPSARTSTKVGIRKSQLLAASKHIRTEWANPERGPRKFTTVEAGAHQSLACERYA